MFTSSGTTRDLQAAALPVCGGHGNRSHSQGGFSLIVALLMLIVIIILGVGASQMAINEERGARSDRDKQIAFQAAEAALKDAEFELLYSTSTATACHVPGETGRGRDPLVAPYTCFNQFNSFGYAAHCSLPPNAGLCDYNSIRPVWVDDDPSHIDFYKDAKGVGDNRTVKYGQFTGKTYGSRESSVSLSGQALSKFPPRYIIELVPKNTSLDSLGNAAHMFRVTAMGFGANENTQVVLQTVVSTKD